MDPKTEVFLRQHLHQFEDGDDVKTIGVYSTRRTAEQAVERLRLQPGFCDTPEGFSIDLYQLDVGSWEEGYRTVTAQAEGAENRRKTGTVSMSCRRREG